jgi:hypothetical protein
MHHAILPHHIITHSSKTFPLLSFSDELLKQLKGMIAEPGKSPKALRLLAMLILRELSPTVGYSINISSLSADPNWFPLVFPLIFAQV